ncbi:MAG: hypothetical protein CBHOC_4774 [uncultured Caballeronia sp.]|nr:MAG: hypothetical protein CBHOC_4774 [uncultured Caballeronia sp.]
MLGDAPLDALTQASPRGMRRAMLNAFGNARIDRRHRVEARDIQLDRASRAGKRSASEKPLIVKLPKTPRKPVIFDI